MLKKIITGTVAALALTVLVPAVAAAHVIVTPNRAGIGQELTFNVSVPNERQVPVINLKLNIPSGVSDVIPTVENGWSIHTTTNNSVKDPEITTITWIGGSIPVGEREDFSFSAQLPAGAVELDWNAYQTYADGTIVHWDQKPSGSDDAVGTAGPYSVTQVVNDLTAATSNNKPNNSVPLLLSVAAITLSVGGLLVRKKTNR